MVNATSTDRELVRIALMYYEEGLTQAGIAKRVGISRSLVSKYLHDAEDAGIVRHVVNSESAYSSRLALQLEQEFGAKKAIVVDTSGIDERYVADLTQQAAVEGFMRDILQAKVIALTWGTTIRGFVDAFPYERNAEATVVPLIGGMGSTAFEVHANQLVHDLAQKLQASCQFVYAPALVADVEMKRSLESNGAIRSVFDVARTADFALLGISSPKVKNYTLKRLGYISEEDLRKLEEAGVMGDVNLSFFDRDGRPMDDVLDSRIVGLGIDDIKPIEKRATVCFVPSKTEALYVALSSGITNYVAMTDSIARELLRMREKDVS